MNGRTFARILLAIVIVGALVGVGVMAYDAGVSAGLAQTGNVVVTPGAYPVAPYVGYGWGFGHAFFGFFGALLFLFLIFALIRAAFGGRHRWGPGGYGPFRGEGHGDWRGSPWESRARDIHDEWHKGQSESGEKPAGS